jgi:Cu(I)/Ag(I) efflux system membrane fusion protein
VFDVTLRVNGYVDRLFIDAVGSAVDKGAPLAWIESPQLAQAQLELLRAVEAAGSDAILGASRQRLLVLGMTDTQIDEVVASKTPLQPVPILAAQSGVVVAKDVVAGQSVSPGMRLVRLARMDKVWVEADVFPDDAAQLRPAQPAKVRLLGSRAAPLAAKVARILPTQGGGASSTVKVRIDVENAGRALVPGSSVIVEIAAVRADALLVPRDAVIPTGARNVVFVDVGGERFMARDVEVGEHSEDDVEIRAGLVEGERVVRRGAFLVAAESRLRAPAAWSAAPSAPVAVPPPSKPAHPHDGGAP